LIIGDEVLSGKRQDKHLLQANELLQPLGLSVNWDGEMRAMYEPIHGSAPDIAGKGLANPIASILSFAMALRYSLDLDKEADILEKAVQDVLNDGLRTKDIMSDGMKETSTSAMGDAIISKLQ
jgi:3-isopropylmalate dehydrogenase